MSSEQAATDPVAEPSGAAQSPGSKSGRGLRRWFLLIAAVIVVDIVAFMLFPPTPKEAAPGTPCPFPACFIESSLEFPAPHTVLDLAPVAVEDPSAAAPLLTFHPAISNTIFTMWIVMAVVLIGATLMARGGKLIPGGGQNVFEAIYEFLSNFGVGLAGPKARPYIPIFAGFFLLILFDNWVGLVPPVGKIELLRAPSSDVNITIGMALVSFVIFHVEGFRHLGVRGYLGKFFPFYEFRNGIGAGVIAMFVGLIELMLEFVKPVTLSMRLFGNIYGGEVALGVITSLTIAIIPVALIGLELMLNAIQALIFSVLTLMFIVLAIESHHDEEGKIAEEALDTVHGSEPSGLQPAH
ncbi:MAG: F-type H+-transporting ATPase subunit a [Solirubrobacterales bacterium]|nr:F-type H+-transporting ATPase subunit a [Solirubrobacterales bacterium]